jgi:hypothetical protein
MELLVHQYLGEINHLPPHFSFVGGIQMLPHILPGAKASVTPDLTLLTH